MRIVAQVGERVLEVEVDREDGRYRVDVDGESLLVDALPLEANFYSILTEGRSYEVSVETRDDAYLVRHGAAEQLVRFADPSRAGREAAFGADGPQKLVSQMPGKVVRVLVEPGDEVEAEQGLLVVEAMKMENEIAAPRAGKVASVDVEPGQAVEAGALLVVIE